MAGASHPCVNAKKNVARREDESSQTDELEPWKPLRLDTEKFLWRRLIALLYRVELRADD